MSPANPRLILHLGQHKTGSKALQSFLSRHARRLRAKAIFYPPGTRLLPPTPAYRHSHFHGYALLRREARRVSGTATAAGEHPDGPLPGKLPSLQAWLQKVETHRRACRAHTVVLSAEDLFDMHSAHELDFDPDLAVVAASLLAQSCRRLGWEPHLVVYLRRQDHLLAAHYAQYIKGPPGPDLDWDAFATAFAPRLDSFARLSPWTSAFGPRALTLRPYEADSLPDGIVPDFFQKMLGMPVPPSWTPPPLNRESANRTPDRDHLEFIRLLRRRERPEWGGLEVSDVLDAALEMPALRDGVSSWLSPAQRRALLDSHAAGNAALAQCAGHPPPFFREPLPDGNAPWNPYPGLSAIAASAIASRARSAQRRRCSWLRRLTRGLGALTS